MADQTIALDVINVSKPCLASWDAMRGNDQLRFCDGCGKNVHNLSAMTKRQAADLLEACAGAGELCVRFARSPDGAVATLDYRAAPTGGSRGWRFWAAFGTCLAAGVAAVNAVVFRKPPPPVGGPTRVMGVMAMSAPTPPPPARVRTTPEPQRSPETGRIAARIRTRGGRGRLYQYSLLLPAEVVTMPGRSVTSDNAEAARK